MLHPRAKDLFTVKALTMLPEDFSDADGVFGADCSAQSTEMVVLLTVGVLGVGAACVGVLVDGERTVEEN